MGQRDGLRKYIDGHHLQDKQSIIDGEAVYPITPVQANDIPLAKVLSESNKAQNLVARYRDQLKPVLNEKAGQTYFPTDRQSSFILKLDSFASVVSWKSQSWRKQYEMSWDLCLTLETSSISVIRETFFLTTL
ncbi:unnamed protein product [Ambrosiozyma monospora]|uniref:Unnamed protein product n=1 Tax=Ambrosiozyma monospora TaxID=43982 RepID=A0ACB5T895_AMBMO|nr:unnamed protein product [Ambrosiozyma monospora]